MTTMQKSVVGAVLVAALGTGLYQLQRASRLEAQTRELEQQQAPLAEQLRQLRQAQEQAAGKLEAAQSEIDQLRRDAAEVPKLRGQLARFQNDARELARLKATTNPASADAAAMTAASWLARVDQLREVFRQNPDKGLPEFQLLTQQDWLDATKDKLETDEDYRRAMSRLRNAAEGKVAQLVQPALVQYLKGSHGKFPTDVSELQAFLKTPMDPAIWQRFSVLPADAVPNVRMGGDWIITQKASVDPDYDLHFVIGPNGHGTTSYNQTPLDILLPAIKAFAAANGGQEPKDPADLRPFLTTPEQQTALQKLAPASAAATTR